MLVRKIIDHFNSYATLHIDVNDVRDQLIAAGVQDKISFHFVEMDSAKIRGILHRYTRSTGVYSDTEYCSDIIISNELDESWRRIVAVKELIHITDNGALSASSCEAVDIIFHNFSIPPELLVGAKNGEVITKSFQNDRLCILLALAILVPGGCRPLLRDLYNKGKLNDREIASIAKIPIRYVKTVLEESFDEGIDLILRWEEVYEES